jgi:CRP-like cAMP-binding protein
MDILRLASLAHLHPLSFEQLGELAPCAWERHVAAGGRLLLDGPLHQGLVLIGSGRAVVRCAGEQIAELRSGDVFGRFSAPRTAYRTATVVAVTDLRLVLFSTRDLRQLVQTAPTALGALINACAIAPSDRAARQTGERPAPRLTLVPAAAA